MYDGKFFGAVETNDLRGRFLNKREIPSQVSIIHGTNQAERCITRVTKWSDN